MCTIRNAKNDKFEFENLCSENSKEQVVLKYLQKSWPKSCCIVGNNNYLNLSQKNLFLAE